VFFIASTLLIGKDMRGTRELVLRTCDWVLVPDKGREKAESERG